MHALARFPVTIAILTSCAALYAQEQAPVGAILAADSSFVQLPGIETEIPAAAGMELRPGYRLKSGAGSIRFAFCPGHTAQTLLPGHELTISASHLPETPGMFAGKQSLPFCELPAGSGQHAAGLGGGQLPPAQAAGLKVDLLDTIRRAMALDKVGDGSAAAEEYRRIASDYPDAAWTRGLIVRHLTETPVPAYSQGKTFALLIGISEYPQESPLGSLQFAHADAESFADFLQSPKGGSVPADQIKLLINAQATRDGIDSAVRTFVDQAAGKQNTLILFIAAHGDFLVTEKDPNTGQILSREPYIVTSDVFRQDVKTTGYPMAEFRDLIAKETLSFGRVIVYVDVCHAGYVRDAPSEKGLQPAVKEVFTNRQGNVGVMLATEANKFAYESPQFGGHGAFTYFVLDGLNGGAARRNSPVITFADLFRHVVNGVGELTNNTQSPDKFVNDDQMPVLDDVTRNPGINLPKASPLPEAATRRRRGSSGGPPQTPEQGSAPGTSEFARLANADPLAAIPVYQRVAADPAVPEQTRRENAEILRVALEEHGQQILITYLHGEQLPQSKSAFELGARYFEEALRLPDATAFDESRMWFCRGRALIFDHQESQYQDAVRLLDRSILLDPAHAYAYNALGIAYLEQVRQHPEYYQRAVAAFHDALRFAPDWAYPMHNLALAWSEQGNFAAAMDSYRAAMRLAPQYSYLPYNLALLNQRMNRLDDADRLYRTALRQAEENRRSGLVPPVTPWREHADVLNALGSVAAARHKYKDAQDFYQRALQDDPQLTEAKYNLAVLLSRAGPSQRAVDLWRENIAARPQEPASRLALGAYLAQNGDKDGAIREYEAAVMIAPDHVAARRELAKLYADQSRWQDAYDQLREARGLTPGHPGIAEEFGDAAAKLGRLVEAADAYREAVTLYSAASDRKRAERKLSAAGKK